MGYRLSYYTCPKDMIEKAKKATDDDYEELLPFEQMEKIYYDITNWIYFDTFQNIVENGNEDSIWKRVFDKHLEVEDDVTIRYCDKKAWEKLINLIRQEILRIHKFNYLGHQSSSDIIDVVDNKKNVDDLPKIYKKSDWKFAEKVNAVEKARLIANEYDYYADIFKIYYEKSDDEFLEMINNNENKYIVSFGSKWENTLSNFLYLYKNFDWKNNVVLIYGG